MRSPVAETPRGDFSQRAQPSASLATSEAGLPEGSSATIFAAMVLSCAAFAARKASSSVLVEDVTGRYSPDILLVDPAFDAAGGDLAGLWAAGLQLGNNAGLSQGQNLRFRRLAGPERRRGFRCDQNGSRVGDHGGMDPAHRAVRILHPPPDVELGRQQHRKTLAAIDPP